MNLGDNTLNLQLGLLSFLSVLQIEHFYSERTAAENVICKYHNTVLGEWSKNTEAVINEMKLQTVTLDYMMLCFLRIWFLLKNGGYTTTLNNKNDYEDK